MKNKEKPITKKFKFKCGNCGNSEKAPFKKCPACGKKIIGWSE
ncbi:hypothetical protein [Methanolapillus africanus]